MRNWKIAASYGVSALALGITLYRVDLAALRAALAAAHLIWLLPCFVMLMMALALRAWRWALLMGNAPFWVTFHALNIGYMLNSTLPLRLGEIGRAFVMGERSPVTMARALSAIVLERLLDLASVILLLVIFAQFVPVPELFRSAATAGLVFAVALLLCGGVLLWQASRAERLLKRVLSRISENVAERWTRRFVDLCEGFRAVGSVARIAGVLALTAVIWAFAILFTFVMMPTFLEPDVSQAGLVLVAANLGGALPAAPGGVGVVQAFAENALVVPFHVPREKALAFVLVYTFGQQLVLVVMGALGLARIKMTFAEVRYNKPS